MISIVNSVYKDGEMTVVFNLENIKEFSAEDLIKNIEDEFVRVTEKNDIKPSVFIPNDFELCEIEEGFVDIYYDIEGVNYFNENIR